MGLLSPLLSGNESVTQAEIDAKQPLAGDRIWCPASMFSMQGGAPTLTGTGGTGSLQGWLLDAATVENVVSTLLVPPWWATLAVDVWWLNAGAGAGAVRLRTVFASHAVGTTVSTTTSDVSATYTAGAQNEIMKATSHVTSVAVDSAVPQRFGILRAGNDAADTLANDILVIGLMLRRLT